MSIVVSRRFSAYASLTLGVDDWRIGTDHAWRGGEQFVAGAVALAAVPALDAGFGDDPLEPAGRARLEISDATRAFRASMFAAGGPHGVAVTLEHETVLTLDDGSESTVTRSQRYLVRAYSADALRVTLDLEGAGDRRLETLYPRRLYTTAIWPQLLEADSDRPLCFAVGTALKLPAVEIARNPEVVTDDGTLWDGAWWHAVCEADPLQTFPITARVTGAGGSYTVTGDVRPILSAGGVIYISNANAVPERHVVAGVSYSAPSSTITVSGTVHGSTNVAGDVVVPPQLLTAYRNGRVIDAAEYEWALIDNPAGGAQWPHGDFGSATGWTLFPNGSGTASIGSGELTLTGDGGATNYGIATRTTADGTLAQQPQRRAWCVVEVEVLEGRVRVGWSALLNATSGGVLGVGVHRFMVRHDTSGLLRIILSSRATGYSGTTRVNYCRLAYAHALTGDDRPDLPRLMALRFTREQRDFNGSPYLIEADVRGSVSRNAVDEIERLLGEAGAGVDATSFAAAAAEADSARMIVDCDHGRGNRGDGAQRRIDAMLRELCTIARARLGVDDAGDYTIVQDVAASAGNRYSESEGDAVQVRSLREPPRPERLQLAYRPRPTNPTELQHVIERAVSGGGSGTPRPIALRYLRDHEAADRLLCYLALRAANNGEIDATLYGGQEDAGARITIESGVLGADTDALAWQVRRATNACDMTLRVYNAAVYTYTPGTPPEDAEADYSPDYSRTPPAAPTGLAVTGNTTALNADGVAVAYLDVECVPPAVNWERIEFVAIRDSTGELTFAEGTANGGVYEATLTGLRPNQNYTVQAYAINANNIRGQVATTPVATATYGTPPANVSSCTAAQGMGRLIEVSWPAVSTANLAEYELERSVGGGGYSVIWRGRTRSYIDRAVSIGTSYQYRVRARDTFGNYSASYATSGSVTPSGNVVGGASGNDIAANTVASANRGSLSTVSNLFALPTSFTPTSHSIAHSLGKVPIVAAVRSSSGAWVMVTSTTTTAINFDLFQGPGSTTSNAPTNPHSHGFVFAIGSRGVTFDIF